VTTKQVFRTHIGRIGRVASTVKDKDCDCDKEAGKAMMANSFLPPSELAKLNRARAIANAARKRPAADHGPILNSASDRVVVGPSGMVAAIRARSGK
jgi:hypothetical protein